MIFKAVVSGRTQRIRSRLCRGQQERDPGLTADPQQLDGELVGPHGQPGYFAREIRPVLRLVAGEKRTRPNLRATADLANVLEIPPGSPLRVRHTTYAAPRRDIQVATSYRPCLCRCSERAHTRTLS